MKQNRFLLMLRQPGTSGLDYLKKLVFSKQVRAQGLCESRGGRPGLPVPNSPYGLCGRKATLNLKFVDFSAQELCESRGGRPGLHVPNSSCG